MKKQFVAAFSLAAVLPVGLTLFFYFGRARRQDHGIKTLKVINSEKDKEEPDFGFSRVLSLNEVGRVE